MEKLLKELAGHSGSRVYLMQDRDRLFVRKIGNVERNYERLVALEGVLPVPCVYSYDGRILDMEYIHGLDITTYLTHHNPKHLTDFLIDILNKISYSVNDKDYTQTYWNKLSVIEDWTPFKFTIEDLISQLPSVLPQTPHYFGDLTLENILYDTTKDSFVLIDPLTSDYDSVPFDIAKLSQDVVCGWFTRNKNVDLAHKLISIRECVAKQHDKYMSDSRLTILMLLRVLPYCKHQSDREFIIQEANRLWM